MYNLLDMDPNNISDNILILLQKNDLYELESKTKSIEKCNNKRIIVLYHYKCLSAPNGYKSLEYDRQLLIDKLGFQPQNILYIHQTKSCMSKIMSCMYHEHAFVKTHPPETKIYHTYII